MKNIIVSCLFFCYIGLSNIAIAQESILYPSDVAYGLHFGRTVSAYGDYIVIGAPKGNVVANLGEAVYIFRKNAGNWLEEARLTATDSIIDQCFGCAVATYSNYILIGAPNDDENGKNSGAAYIFKNNGNGWAKQIKLTPSDPSEFQSFGSHVSLDGDYALISSTSDNINGQFNSGSAYIFKRNGDQWLQEAKLIPSDPTISAVFGIRVSIYGDYAFVGATRAYNDNNIKTGAIYVFEKIGNEWIEQVKLVSSDGQHGDVFSNPIATESTLFVAAAKAPGNNEYSKGVGYIFSKDGEDWIEEHKLIPYDEEEDQALWGWSFNENYAVLANANNPHSGVVHLFHKKNADWSEVKTLTASNGDQYDRYGGATFLANNNLIVGAYNNFYQDSDSVRTGAVYVYDLDLLVPDKEAESIEVSINLYPNPSTESLTLSINNAIVPIFKRLEIYDMNGRLLRYLSQYEFDENKGNWTIDISSLVSGAYIIRGISSKYVFSKRFVKK